MDSITFTLVLCAALSHAVWNAMIKRGGDALVRLALLQTGCAVAAIAVLVLSGPPPMATLPWILGSSLVHWVYMAGLLASYRAGDYSLVYPLARGAAPLLVALGSWCFAGESMGAGSWAAVLLVCVGILGLARPRTVEHRPSSAAVFTALATAVAIAGYSLIDGMGGRVAGEDVLGYVAVLFLVIGGPVVALAALRRRGVFWRAVRHNARAGLLAGTLSAFGYGTVIWAMSRAPMTLVSALRETSALMAAVIGVVFLRERSNGVKWLSVAAVTVGVVLLHLQ